MLTHLQKCVTCVSPFQTFLSDYTCIYATYTPHFLPFSKHATSDCHAFLHLILLPRKPRLSAPGVIPIFLQILSNPNAISLILPDRADFWFLFSPCVITVLSTLYCNFIFPYLFIYLVLLIYFCATSYPNLVAWNHKLL